MMTIEEQKDRDKKLKEYIFRESLKVNEETKEALCRIEQKYKITKYKEFCKTKEAKENQLTKEEIEYYKNLKEER